MAHAQALTRSHSQQLLLAAFLSVLRREERGGSLRGLLPSGGEKGRGAQNNPQPVPVPMPLRVTRLTLPPSHVHSSPLLTVLQQPLKPLTSHRALPLSRLADSCLPTPVSGPRGPLSSCVGLPGVTRTPGCSALFRTIRGLPLSLPLPSRLSLLAASPVARGSQAPGARCFALAPVAQCCLGPGHGPLSSSAPSPPRLASPTTPASPLPPSCIHRTQGGDRLRQNRRGGRRPWRGVGG